MEEVVSFNHFTFDCNSGELIDASNKKEKGVTRLQPQSAKLLQLLIQKHPQLVSKEEIKSLLWPDVEVDFDNSLHFCIRQIRAALEDDVSNPKYIETIPRRGYRWLVPIGSKKKRKPILAFVLAITLLGILAVSVNYYISKDTPIKSTAQQQQQQQQAIRLVIMPIQPTDSTHLFYNNTIAYDLLALLSQTDFLEIIGPTTTQNISQENIYEFMGDSGADFVINGKFSDAEQESELLLEIIRTSDYAHVWVTSFNTESSVDQIVSAINKGLFEKAIDLDKIPANKK